MESWIYNDNARVVLVSGLFGAFFLIEKIAPLRKPVAPKIKRVVRNFSHAAISLMTVRFLSLPLLIRIATFVSKQELGLLGILKLTWIVETAIALIALDYTLYFWHRLNHSLPFLWRFHGVHHIDLDLDVSTAVRFHFGELLLSVFYRAAQIALLGVDPIQLALFETSVVTFAQFHHANIRLPLKLDKFLSTVLITPRIHGIHHSMVRTETDSNFGTVFSLWDRFHRTKQSAVPQEMIRIGVPSYASPDDQSFLQTLTMPFKRIKPWGPDSTRLH